MRWLQRIFLIIGIVCLGLYGFFTVQARIEQSMLEEELYVPRPSHPGPLTTKYKLQEGDLFGRLEVPRLNMSVMVMEGIDDKTLRLGAGHVPDTPLVFAAHRDTFFRALKDIQKDDIVYGIDDKLLTLPPPMSARQFNAYVRLNYNVGDHITLNVIRSGQRLSLPMVLADRDTF